MLLEIGGFSVDNIERIMEERNRDAIRIFDRVKQAYYNDGLMSIGTGERENRIYTIYIIWQDRHRGIASGVWVYALLGQGSGGQEDFRRGRGYSHDVSRDGAGR